MQGEKESWVCRNDDADIGALTESLWEQTDMASRALSKLIDSTGKLASTSGDERTAVAKCIYALSLGMSGVFSPNGNGTVMKSVSGVTIDMDQMLEGYETTPREAYPTSSDDSPERQHNTAYIINCIYRAIFAQVKDFALELYQATAPKSPTRNIQGMAGKQKSKLLKQKRLLTEGRPEEEGIIPIVALVKRAAAITQIIYDAPLDINYKRRIKLTQDIRVYASVTAQGNYDDVLLGLLNVTFEKGYLLRHDPQVTIVCRRGGGHAEITILDNGPLLGDGDDESHSILLELGNRRFEKAYARKAVEGRQGGYMQVNNRVVVEEGGDYVGERGVLVRLGLPVTPIPRIVRRKTG